MSHIAENEQACRKCGWFEREPKEPHGDCPKCGAWLPEYEPEGDMSELITNSELLEAEVQRLASRLASAGDFCGVCEGVFPCPEHGTAYPYGALERPVRLAAPDLLEALQAAMTYMPGHGADRARASAAITRAMGPREPDWKRLYMSLFMAVGELVEEFGGNGFTTDPDELTAQLRERLEHE